MIARHLQKRTALHRVDKLLRTLRNAAVDGSIDRFAVQAELYARSRPRYPLALLDVLDQSVHRHELAMDVGTGSGQLAVPLSSYFHNIVALDKVRLSLSFLSLSQRYNPSPTNTKQR
jgi:methylase of polypeptide subunit release factors